MKFMHLSLMLAAGIFAGFLCGAAVTIARGDAPKFDGDQVVAQVGETTFTRGELAQQIIAQYGNTFLDKNVRDQLIVEEAARRAGVTVSADELNQRVEESRKFAESQNAQNRLEELPRWLLAENLRPLMLLEKLLNLKVTPEEVKDYYQHNLGVFTRQAMAKLIPVATYNKDDADRACQRLRDGEDPLVVSAQVTTDVRFKGVHDQWFTRDAMSPKLAKAIFYGNKGKPLRPKQCTDVIQVDFPNLSQAKTEYFVFYVLDILPNSTAPLDTVTEAATFYARAQKLSFLSSPWYRAHANDIAWQRSKNVDDPQSELITAPIPLEDYPIRGQE